MPKIEYIDRVEAIRHGISYDLLIDVVSGGGAAIDINGHLSCDPGDHMELKESMSSYLRCRI